MKPVKVLIVDDSAFMRTLIKDMLTEDNRIHVVDTAKNGMEALEKIKKYKPDVVTLDVEMPVMNGLDALKAIMTEHPLPVIMLSSSTTEGAKNTILAMTYGAFDFVAKPSGAISLDIYKVKDQLIEKIIEAQSANIKQLSEPEPGVHKEGEFIREASQTFFPGQAGKRKNVVLIGTSTGGRGHWKQFWANCRKM